MADPERTQRILSELARGGLRSRSTTSAPGYSSLARLKHMPVDVLKIDQAFVRDVEVDGRLAGMVRAMIQVAHSLDMVPLAEGIETEGESSCGRTAAGSPRGSGSPARCRRVKFEALARTGEPLGPSTV